jgi:hypothetical protein
MSGVTLVNIACRQPRVNFSGEHICGLLTIGNGKSGIFGHGCDAETD